MSSYGLWLAAAGMKVNDHRQTVLANNMANSNTTGFKHDLAVVMQRRVESQESASNQGFAQPALDGISGGLHVRPSHHSFAQGYIEHTGKPLDVAIQGQGFFAVSDGEVTRYTRDGEFTRNAVGELVLAAGNGRWKVLSEDDSPILLSEDGEPASIAADGSVREGQTVVAKLGMLAPDDEQAARKVGANLFAAKDSEMTPMAAELVPGAREGSNFDVMQGLASMIKASRAYQLNATMIQLQDQITGQAISRVGRAR